MSEGSEEATDLSEHTYCQLPGARLTGAEQQQSEALHCMED